MDMTPIAIVAIVFGSAVAIIRIIFDRPRHARRGAEDTARTTQDFAEMAALAERLNRRIESLEQLLDATQPEWRGKP